MDAGFGRDSLRAATFGRMPIMRHHFVNLLAVVGLLAAALTVSGCGDSSAAAGTPQAGTVDAGKAPMIRVLLYRDVPVITIAADGSVIAGRTEDRPPVRLSLPDAPVRVARAARGWKIGDASIAGDVLTLTPGQDGDITLGDRSYRGRLRLVPRETGRFDVVNDLDLESYLAGVLPKELPPTWHDETFAAQAVVARTYALYEIRTAGGRRGHFDVYDNTNSQVYGGSLAETPKAREAVFRTRGQVVAQDTDVGPRIFKAYFHSTSGGVTLGADEAFNEPPSAALSPQQLGDLGNASSRFEWDPVLIDKSELTRRIKAWGERRKHPLAKMSQLVELRINRTNAFGRPTRFEIIDARGDRYVLTAEETRWAVNSDRRDAPALLSGWFKPINNPRTVVFANGRGWGHGVGMCQWSAQGMAARGDDYRQILARSYPTSSVLRAY
jgi:stage II sporulation protein D